MIFIISIFFTYLVGLLFIIPFGLIKPHLIGLNTRKYILKIWLVIFILFFITGTIFGSIVKDNDSPNALILFLTLILSLFTPYLYKRYKNFNQSHTIITNEPSQTLIPIPNIVIEVEQNQEPKNFNYSNLVNKRVIIIYRDTNNNETQRTINVTGVSKKHINAFCHLRNGTRTFKKDRILSIFNPDTGESMDTDLPRAVEVKSKRYNTIKDILKYHQEEFKEKNFYIDITEDSISLYEYFKNGKVRKTPFLSLEYNLYATSYYYEDDEFERGIEEESTRPWCIRGKELHTRTFKDFNKASRIFVEFANKSKP